MKILYYSSHPTLSQNAQTGPGTHMCEIINALRELGHDVLPVIMGDEGTPLPLPSPFKNSFIKRFAKIIIPGIIWRSLKEYKLLKFDTRAESVLKKNIEQFHPDLVYERAAYLQLSGVKLIKQKKIVHFMEINAPFIEEVRQFEDAPSFWLRKAKHAERIQIQYPDRVYVVSSVLKKYYLQYTSDESKIEIVPNCVNTNYLIVNNELKHEIIAKYGLENKKIAGFVGSIFPYHGVDILLSAFAEIAINNKDIVLLIVGDGSIIPDLKLLSEKLKIKERVIFTGSVPHKNIFTYISLMDIAIMAKSNRYGSPVKLFEYGAMKKAIIAPNTMPVQDVMEHNTDGLLIDSTKEQLISAMNLLLNNPELAKNMAKTFHTKVLENYTWHKAAKKIIESVKLFER